MPTSSKHSPCVGIRTCSDYSPFGVELDGRSVSGGYRFGYQGSEKDNEFKGDGNSYTTEFRQLDPRLGRWLTIDPLFGKFPDMTPYNAYGNNPILNIDEKGDTIKVSTKKGKYLFSLDDGKPELRKMTAEEVYDAKIQWFEPLADNYMPLTQKASDLWKNDALKHFSWDFVIEWSNEDYYLFQYASGMPGDFKSNETAGDGWLLCTVDGEPYWVDAIGQIPFAIDAYSDYLEESFDQTKAVYSAIWQVIIHGEGKLVGGKADFSNTYDNYMGLRACIWAARHYRVIDGEVFRVTNPGSEELEKPINKSYKNKYLSKLKSSEK